MFITISYCFTLVVLPMTLVYLYLTRNFNYWKNQNLPYVTPVPLFGNVFKVFMSKESIGQFIVRIHKSSQSPYLGFFVFDQPFLLIRDPVLIKHFLIKDFNCFDERSLIENKCENELESDALFVNKNPSWKHIRSKLNTAFSTRRLKKMVPLMVDASEDLITYLNKAVAFKLNPIDTREISMKYSTDVITSCAFGINSQSFIYHNEEFSTASKRVFEWTCSRSMQMTLNLFAPILVKLFKIKFLDPTCTKFLNKAFWKNTTERELSGSLRGDLIDTLIQIQRMTDASGCHFYGDKLVAQTVQYFIAGNESSASIISYTLYELSLNTSVQHRLRSEIRRVLRKCNPFSYELLHGMPYLDMVVCETLRKYPVLPFIDRRCTNTYKIPGTDIIIGKGIPVYISLLGFHLDPQYFPDPERYDPERFSFENRKSRPPFVYMPFGEGLHNCIGGRFGLLSAKIGLIRILSNFAVSVSEHTPIPLKFNPKSILLAPENEISGLPLHFRHVDTTTEL